MSKVKVRIINQSSNPLPEYATEEAAGMDIRAHLETALVLKPLERFLVPTGLFIELPKGYEAQIRPRSGLAIKQGLTCLNSPGTIDADYRGEVLVLLVNLGQEEAVLEPGERIAQLVIAPVTAAVVEEAAELPPSGRGAGGFGSTGRGDTGG